MARTLSVCTVTTDSSDRLGWWCEQVRQYADHLVIAVDAGSSDDTYAIASRHADQVYAVDVDGQLALARDWLHHRAEDDWTLMLDDDEVLPPDAGSLLPDLLDDRDHTHHLFPLRRVVEYEGALGWVPDPDARSGLAIRLWRNLGGLHFVGAKASEPPRLLGLGRSQPEHGRLGVFSLRHLWSAAPATIPGTPLSFDVPRRLGPRSTPTESPVASEVTSAQQLNAHLMMVSPTTPPWSAAYRLIEAPPELTTNRGALMRIAVRNTSRALWPTFGQRAGRIILSNRWSTPEFGEEVPMGEATLLPHPLSPGEEVVLEVGLWTPRLPGRYRLTVELLRDGDSWFSQHGVAPLVLDVIVGLGDAPLSTRHYVGRLADDPDRDPSIAVPSLVVARPSVRVLDTRDGSGLRGAESGPIDQDGMVVLRLAGAAGVPPDASGAVITVTVLDTDYNGWLAVFGTDGTKGEAFPVLHFSADGAPVTATATVPLGVGRGHGGLSFHLSPGPPGTTGQLIVDVSGYLVPTS